jgi:hypothetical protein
MCPLSPIIECQGKAEVKRHAEVIMNQLIARALSQPKSQLTNVECHEERATNTAPMPLLRADEIGSEHRA